MQYFKHFGTMRHDIKIKRVVAKFGLEGYGLYNMALESITESLSTGSPLPDLQETCEDIAEFYNGNTAKINEIMNFMVNQGLFELDEMSGRILCNRLYKFLDTSQTRSVELRAMIKGFKAATAPQIEDKSDTVSDSHVPSEIVCAESDRIRKEKEKKKNKKIKEDKYNPLDDLVFFNDSDFQEVWKDYLSVRTKKKAAKSDRAIKAIIQKLSNFAKNKDEAIAIITKSADSGWSDIYDIKREVKIVSEKPFEEMTKQEKRDALDKKFGVKPEDSKWQ